MASQLGQKRHDAGNDKPTPTGADHADRSGRSADRIAAVRAHSRTLARWVSQRRWRRL